MSEGVVVLFFYEPFYYLERRSFMFEALHNSALCSGAECDGVEHRPVN